VRSGDLAGEDIITDARVVAIWVRTERGADWERVPGETETKSAHGRHNGGSGCREV